MENEQEKTFSEELLEDDLEIEADVENLPLLNFYNYSPRSNFTDKKSRDNRIKNN